MWATCGMPTVRCPIHVPGFPHTCNVCIDANGPDLLPIFFRVPLSMVEGSGKRTRCLADLFIHYLQGFLFLFLSVPLNVFRNNATHFPAKSTNKKEQAYDCCHKQSRTFFISRRFHG